MKVSVFMAHLQEIASKKGCSLQAVLKEAKKCGIDYVDLDYDKITNPQETLRLLNAAELKPGGMNAFFDFGHVKQPELRHAVLATAEAMKVACVMVVPGFMNEGDDYNTIRENMAAELREFCLEASLRGVTVTMEDFDNERAPFGKAEELLWFFEHVPHLYCAFDTGNFIFHGGDVLKAYDLLEPYIRHVHMKDRAFAPMSGEAPAIAVTKKKLYPAPVGNGELPMAEIVRRLYEHGYDGLFVMEHFGAGDQLLYMRRSARWMKNIFR